MFVSLPRSPDRGEGDEGGEGLKREGGQEGEEAVG